VFKCDLEEWREGVSGDDDGMVWYGMLTMSRCVVSKIITREKTFATTPLPCLIQSRMFVL